jgi:hypothetical protein
VCCIIADSNNTGVDGLSTIANTFDVVDDDELVFVRWRLYEKSQVWRVSVTVNSVGEVRSGDNHRIIVESVHLVVHIVDRFSSDNIEPVADSRHGKKVVIET